MEKAEYVDRVAIREKVCTGCTMLVDGVCCDADPCENLIAGFLEEPPADVVPAHRKENAHSAPLTLAELRQMDGEPVWWWNKSAKPVCTICVWDRFMDEPMFANYDWQSEDTLKLSKYKWLKKCGYKPYRQKPEEDDHEN